MNSTNSSLAQPPGPVVWHRAKEDWTASCSECNELACKHVMEFFRARHELVIGPLPELSKFAVPIFRNIKGISQPLIAFISTGEEDEYGNKPFRLAYPENIESEIIDTLSPSSGVWAIRNSTIQFAFSKVNEVKDCISDTHRRGWPFAPGVHNFNRRPYDAKRPEIIADILCIMANGACARCTFGEHTSLVPEL